MIKKRSKIFETPHQRRHTDDKSAYEKIFHIIGQWGMQINTMLYYCIQYPMKYLDAISKKTEWSWFISKANHSVIQVYALTSNAEEAEIERFYEDLQELLELTPKKDVLFMIGYWNAKVVSQEIPGVTDKFGLGVQNKAPFFQKS